MASNTPNLNLLKKDPATDGNDTFNIQTMLNDNWDKIDVAVGEVREELKDINVPDASLTQKGITQLSSATDSTAEDRAATPRAVKAAYDEATAARVTANTANTAAAAAQAKADAAFPKTGGPITRVATTDNGWNTAHVEIRNTGSSISTNMPRIAFHSNGAGVAKQVAGDHIRGGVSVLNEDGNTLTNFNCNELRFSVNGVTHTSTELFTSVSNGKNAVAAAIAGKNVPASGSDPFPVLAEKIGQISTISREATGSSTSGISIQNSGTGSVTGDLTLSIRGLAFTPRYIALEIGWMYAAGNPVLSFEGGVSNFGYNSYTVVNGYNNSNNTTYSLRNFLPTVGGFDASVRITISKMSMTTASVYSEIANWRAME
ncbi:MAG: phage tail protein [Paenibacillus macerans]|uniref:phage tail protein n=1 Tax=Paenibacillus macerans TaxID=44252 RepID=UPI002906DAB0|nr:phage tail protein [Paenibacillus macerans]MDU7476482.1 phage tail protein [Paenibacillus macerans]